ncbi:MAG: alkaline phosphatase D family protein [Planctomycetia bacterium]|nr:alkaline phosphatase D family protein [Planctomycetia bacterium]
MNNSAPLSRRGFLATSATLAATSAVGAEDKLQSRQASGVKVGEVTDSSAIIWTRLTAKATRNADGPKVVGRPGKEDQSPTASEVPKLLGACPGAAGRIRVRYGTKPDLSDAKSTDWIEVTEKTDFSHQFALKELPSDTVIHFAVETTNPDKTPHAPLTGTFRTAPKPDAEAEVTFAVITCQMFADLDHADGFHIYPAIGKLAPRFVAFTGDNVYYDSEQPVARTPALARYHWQRMYSLPRHIELLRQLASYWEKDDHDTLKNDSWAGQKQGELTFEEGLRIFRQQVPMSETIYRTFRWGKFVQVWLTDGRDFRSPNSMKDGPEKTIWGKEQKAWMFRTLKESDALWKVIISPTPIVGPDRPNKRDNHANEGFKHEGDEIRAFLKKNLPHNCFTICGDRHWQYHSVHPETGLNEFSIGAASDQHAGGSPGEKKDYHRFHRVKGGFLSVSVNAKGITFRHHDVNGKVVYEREFKTK